MATGKIPAPGVFYVDKRKDEKTSPMEEVSKVVSEKKVQWIECLLESNADDVYEMIPVDETLTAKVIARRDTLTLEQLGKLVLEKEQARFLTKTIAEATEELQVEPKFMEVEITVLPGEASNRKLPDIDLSESELTTEQVAQVQELLSEFSDVYSRDYGRTSLLTHSINTDGAAPIKKTPYRLPQSYLQAAEEHFKEIAEDDLIEPTISPWRAPIVRARKRDGSLRHFPVVTDHKPLVGSRNIDPGSDPTGRRARWAIELSTYDFVIVHRDGSEYKNADALSRVPAETVNNVRDDAMGNLRIQQQADVDISQLRGWIEQGRKPRASSLKSGGRELRKLYDQYGRCSLRDGVVYRRWKPTNKVEWQWQVVLPKTMRENAIYSLHDESGHFCHTKTLNRVKDRYFWPGMSTEVKDWCTKCAKCQRKRDAVPNLRAPLQPIITTTPRELVTRDLVEYPVSNDGNRYALVVIDNFTKYLELFALNERTASAITDRLAHEYIPRLGAPEQLYSDQGKNLNAKIVIDVRDILQTCKTRTTPFHPQSDGATERVIRTVNLMLAKVVSENQNDWDEKLPGVNSAVHGSTEFTPYFHEHGREMRLPVNLVATPVPEPGYSQTAFGKKLRTTLENAFQAARESLNTAHRRQKVGYDRWT
ncbi:Transposon Tf2-8 polyprotein [Stylophora pistillata]|uniref:Transposon Tf2-8 polyprotein n=1 Tax=Stylophora pistillata TaxID=50429 RepID=A0A2B4T1B6_STYPI|nr:Transposon Tf2-8 polyprotein [Stylophora pistillata]